MTDALIRQTKIKGGGGCQSPQVPWLSSRTHRTQHKLMHTHDYDFLQAKDTEWNQQRVKASGVKSEETRHKLWGSSPSGVTQDAPNSPSNELWRGPQGKLLGDSASSVSIGDSQVSILCLTCTKSLDTQKERRVQHKQYWLYKCFRRRKSLFWALGKGGSLLRIPPRDPLIPSLKPRAFYG